MKTPTNIGGNNLVTWLQIATEIRMADLYTITEEWHSLVLHHLGRKPHYAWQHIPGRAPEHRALSH